MSVRVNVREFQKQLVDILDRADTGERCVVERRGKEPLVLVRASEWDEHELGKQLDVLGPEYRLSKVKQARLEVLLEKNANRRLTKVEETELQSLLDEGDEIMLRRARALENLP